jgi:preprotein translocase subunit SecE
MKNSDSKELSRTSAIIILVVIFLIIIAGGIYLLQHG